MGIRKALYFAAVCSTFTLWGVAAGADEQAAPGARVVVLNEGLRLPVPYVERPLTYSPGILNPELDFNIYRFGFNVFGNAGGADAIGAMAFGSGYSITEDFGVRATLFELQFNKNFGLDVGALGATYRLIRGSFELGLALDWIYQASAQDDLYPAAQDILPSLPMRVHFGHVVRLDLTPTLPITTQGIYVPGLGAFGGGKATVGFAFPVALSIQPVDQLHFGVGTGFSFAFNAPSGRGPIIDFGDSFYIPLDFEVGVTVPGPHGPVFDMTPFFALPTLFVPGIQNGVDAVQSGVWQAGVKFTGYFYL
jgi:hypothetical protein